MVLTVVAREVKLQVVEAEGVLLGHPTGHERGERRRRSNQPARAGRERLRRRLVRGVVVALVGDVGAQEEDAVEGHGLSKRGGDWVDGKPAMRGGFGYRVG